MKFTELNLIQPLLDSLADMGFEEPTPIQQQAVPVALEGQDLIGQAQTGTGKTAAFGLPMLNKLDKNQSAIQGLVVAPTRELAIQVQEELYRLGKYQRARIYVVYGGSSIGKQIEWIKRNQPQIVVGTPGRILDLMRRKALSLKHLKTLVLDEADEMLNLGFLPAIEKLLKALTHKHQTMLFSATMPGPIVTLARTFMHKPVHIRAEEPDAAQTNQDIRQVVFQAHRMDKVAVVSRILQAQGRGKTIIFARTKRSAAELANDLAASGFLVGAVHGDMGQPAREKSLTAFRSGDIEILVATDVAARGIDIDDVTHVINYQTPDDEMTYVHRIGRTGRAGHTGTAVTLVGYDELPKWQLINSELNLDNPEPPQWFSTSPELFDALDIPESASVTVGPARKVFGGAMVTRPAQARSLARGGRKEGRSGRRKADPRRRS